jgi:Flp pilus assembly pilin Flp
MSQWEHVGSNITGEFGQSVSLSANGQIMAIGAPKRDVGGSVDIGIARVYQNVNGTWTQIGSDIVGEAAGDQFGTSVSLNTDGTILAVGANLNDGVNGTNSGHVRVYQNINGTWTKIGQDIDGEAGGDQSGISVSLNGDGTVVAIGAHLNRVNTGNLYVGHCRIFRNISGTWTQIGSDIDSPYPNDQYQYGAQSVSLSKDGTIVVIGTPRNNNTVGGLAGLVRVYQDINGTWTQVGQDVYGEGANDQFGQSVSLNANGTIFAAGGINNNGVNGAGAGHVRVYQNINGTWTKIGQDIDGEAAGDMFGWSVSLNWAGTIVAAGSYWNSGGGLRSGHVRIYENVNGTWTKLGQDLDGTGNYHYMGWSVSLNSSGYIVAQGADGAGYVRVSRFPPPVVVELQSTLQTAPAGSVSLSSILTALDTPSPSFTTQELQTIKTNLRENITALSSSKTTLSSQIVNAFLTEIKPNFTLPSEIFTIVAPKPATPTTPITITMTQADILQAKEKPAYILATVGETINFVINNTTRALTLNESGGVKSVSYLGTSYNLGSKISFDDGYSFTILGFGSLLGQFGTPMLPVPVTVNFEVEIAGNSNLSVFGSEAPIVSNVIVAERQMPVAALYDAVNNKGLIELWEPSSDPENIYVQLANSNFENNLSGAYEVTAKIFAKELQKILCDEFNCIGAAPFSDPKYSSSGTPITQYTKQRDFGRLALAVFAHYMFGHVDATAAITNDNAFVKNILSLNKAGVDATTAAATGTATDRYLAYDTTEIDGSNILSWAVTHSATDANLAKRLTVELIKKGLDLNSTIEVSKVNDPVITAEEDKKKKLAWIVRQVVGQDATRLMNEDNSERTLNYHRLLRFYAGDMIYLNIKLAKPTVSVGSGQQSGITPTSLADSYQLQSYTIKITLV